MHVRPLIAAIASVLVALPLLSEAAAPAATPSASNGPLPDVIATRQTTFSIPFTLPATFQPGEEPTEVRLYWSSDGGRNWQFGSRVSPKQNSFVFKAPNDGEYWFLIRTVDRAGRLKPDGSRTPELRVVVDTLPPRLDLSAGRGPAGEVNIHWAAVDPLLKADSLIVEYQVQGDPQWRGVSINQPRDDGRRSTLTGDAQFRPMTAGPVTVRAEISDRAGNVAVATATAGPAQASQMRPANSAAGGWTSATPTSGPSLNPPQEYQAPQENPAPQSAPVGSASPASKPGESYGAPINTAPYRPNPNDQRGADRHDLTASNWPYGARSSTTADAPQGVVWPADQITSQPVTGPALTRQSLAEDSAASHAVASPINPPVANRVAPPSESSPTAVTAARPVAQAEAPPASTAAPSWPTAENMFTQGLRPGERPYMVNSKKFALEYQVESIGPSGLSKIEIWGTRDGGRTWASYGVEPARQGPVHVQVDSEGLYGFRITVRDGNGLSGRAPQAGDLPELWVGVDLTKPSARIVGAELGAGDRTGQLIVRWEASDAMLAARPVTLLFSDRAGGPWSTIAAGLENSGVYAWRFDNRAPEQVFLRLEVRDDAGNVGQFETTSPVMLTAGRPVGNLRAAPPIVDPSGRAPTNQFYR